MRKPVMLLSGAVISLSVASCVATQRASDRSPTAGGADVTAAQPADKSHAPKDVASDSSANDPNPDDLRVHYLLVSLSRLKAAMHDELALTSAQVAAVDGLFDKYLHALRDAKADARPFGVAPGDMAATETLRRELTQAHEEGDVRKVAELSAKFNQRLLSRQQKSGVTTDQFFARVAEELTEHQRDKFRARIKKLRIGNDRPPMPRELKKFRRALSGRAMRLDPWKRRHVQTLLKKGASEVAYAEATGGDRDAAILAVRESIVAELTAEQAVMFGLKLRLNERALRKGGHGGMRKGLPRAKGPTPPGALKNDPSNKRKAKP